MPYTGYYNGDGTNHAPWGLDGMRKADYRKIAETYDAARPLSEQNLEWCLDIISTKIGSQRKMKFLDLGCGTGRFSIPITS